MFCPKCGSELPEGSQFCDNCGEKIVGEKAPIPQKTQKKTGGRKIGGKVVDIVMITVGVICIMLTIIMPLRTTNYIAAEGRLYYPSWYDITINPWVLIGILAFSVYLNYKILKRMKNRKCGNTDNMLEDSVIDKFSDYFVSSDEKYVASIGNGYIANFFLNGKVKKGFSVISNKRVYFKGKCFTGRGKSFVKTNEERTVDLKDVTGSGFIYKRYIGILLGMFIAFAALVAVLVTNIVFISVGYEWGVTSIKEDIEDCEGYIEDGESQIKDWKKEIKDLKKDGAGDDEIESIQNSIDNKEDSIADYKEQLSEDKKAISSFWRTVIEGMAIIISLILSCILVFFDYLKRRKTLFEIQYAGGHIAFNVSYYAKAEIDDFQKQLRLAKDYTTDNDSVKFKEE